MNHLSLFVVALIAIYLLGLGVLLIQSPSRAQSFLGAFAQSNKAHILEQCVRIAAGIAFILASSQMNSSRLFWGFGWVLCVTSVLLLALPWRWHKRFADRVVPAMLLHTPWFALGSLMAGLCVVYGLMGLR